MQRNNLAARKQAVLDYILASVSDDEFNRGSDLNVEDEGQVFGFNTYDEFVYFQETSINAAEEYQLQTLEFLKNQIIPISKSADLESTSMSDIAGFVFNASGQFVFINPR